MHQNNLGFSFNSASQKDQNILFFHLFFAIDILSHGFEIHSAVHRQIRLFSTSSLPVDSSPFSNPSFQPRQIPFNRSVCLVYIPPPQLPI